MSGDESWELCSVDLDVAQLPSELLRLEDPGTVFSLDTWYNVLNDDEREHLCHLLPKTDRDDPSELLEHVFENPDFHFGNPVQQFWRQLIDGRYHPRVDPLVHSLRELLKKQHFHVLKDHHEKMMTTFEAMKSVFNKMPDANVDDKLRAWNEVKDQILASVTTQGAAKQVQPDLNDFSAKVAPKDPEAKSAKVGALLDALPAPEEKPAFSVRQLFHAIRLAMLRGRLGAPGGFAQWTTTEFVVRRVRERPCDPRILNADGDVAGLVLAGLKILETKAPPGTRLWKQFLQSRRHGTEWVWVGTVPRSTDELVHNASCESWGSSEKGMAKLEERFVKFCLENGVRFAVATESQLAEEPPPPPLEAHTQNEPLAPSGSLADGVKGASMRNQVTLPASAMTARSRALFQEEERQRYRQPSKAFRYTAADGGRSTVAPAVRAGAKAQGKARDHAMLKLDRPPSVTVLSLVRDAASRLPNGMGTRADVCTLLRDSQFVVKDTPDNQVHQTVSGAMDRLHYERDPCVKFDPDRKLWTYRHRLRNPDDFLPDGSLSARQGLKRKGASAEGDEPAGGQWGEAEAGSREEEEAGDEGEGDTPDGNKGSAADYNKREGAGTSGSWSVQRSSYSQDPQVKALSQSHQGAHSYGENHHSWDNRDSSVDAKSDGHRWIRFKFAH